ncbi:hypothetical protein ACFSL6_12630 [Paenibacillus thailandensis]|uniref:Uncharacterized protein n=1 Tax=Paenibacillus thailandensis TaxID=393250 RepID=A0ABW5R0L4_9BACL
MNEYFPEADIGETLDIISLNKRHVFIPFKTANGYYGMGFWTWKGFGWDIQSVHTRGEPFVWKLDGNDPSSQYIVWNVDPADGVSEVQFYLIRDRYGSQSRRDGEMTSRYMPRIQLSWNASLQERSYGAVPFPEDWAAIIEEEQWLTSERQPSLFSWEISGPAAAVVGWMPVNRQGAPVFPERSVNGSSHSDGSADLGFITILNPTDLERPE